MKTPSHPYTSYCKWNPSSPTQQRGFILASDQAQEWLLPWWWENYKKHNNTPVTFIDLGLSLEMRHWCKERGHYIHLPVPDIFVLEKRFFSKTKTHKLERKYGRRMWDSRNAWFKKPLACLQTPYQKTVWIDLDCEVRGSLQPLFDLPFPEDGIVIGKEYFRKKERGVNSGVFIFEKGAPIMEEWAEESLYNNKNYPGDQDILYDLMIEKKIPLIELPSTYNWSRLNKPNPDAIVLHWHGVHGKTYIIHEIQKETLRKEGLLV